MVIVNPKKGLLHDASHCPNCSQRPEVQALTFVLGPTSTPAEGEEEVTQWVH